MDVTHDVMAASEPDSADQPPQRRTAISLIDNVSTIIRELSDEHLMWRFRNPGSVDIEEKSPGDFVTSADHAMEEALSRVLPQLLPGSRVIGEEAVSANPALMDTVENGDVWIVDPVDGTRNFIEGSPDFATMVALVRNGEAVASWILAPARGTMIVAQRGAGVRMDDEEICLRGRVGGVGLTGVLSTRYLPEEWRQAFEQVVSRLPGIHVPSGAAGIDYPRLLQQEVGFLFYWRTLAWDHVPGSLIISEAGGMVRRLDGSEYRAGDQRRGLLVACDEQSWHQVRDLLPSVPAT
jgi:fructose-1,6-bisphosphatase/inositol monophosphatase family enzyme